MNRSPVRFVIMASGRGSNAVALMDYAAANPTSIEIVGLISDRAEAPVLAEARQRKVETFIIAHKNESSLLSVFERLRPEWALLAGYRRLVSDNFLKYFWDEQEKYARVLNIHPSLLPVFPGLNAYEQAFNAGVKISGVTVHLVDRGLDTGHAVLQAPLERLETDSLASFEERGLRLEHQLFCRAVELAAAKRIHLRPNPQGTGNFVSLAVDFLGRN